MTRCGLIPVSGGGLDLTRARSQPLHLAAYFGHTASVSLLLAWGAEVEVRRAGGVLPLAWAAQQGHPEVCALLCERGARCDARDEAGDTPLHAACRAGQVAAAAALLAAGSQPAAGGAGGASALHAAAEAACPPLVRLLLAHVGAGGAAALLACRSRSGATPLHAGGRSGCVATVGALLEAGADATARDDNGRTAAAYGVGAARELLVARCGQPEVDLPAADFQASHQPAAPSINAIAAAGPLARALAAASVESVAVPVAVASGPSWPARLPDTSPLLPPPPPPVEAESFESLCLRLAGRVLARLGGSCPTHDTYASVLALECALAAVPFVGEPSTGGLHLQPAGGGGLLLLSTRAGGLPAALERLEDSLVAMPELEAGGVLHFEGGQLHARFLARD